MRVDAKSVDWSYHYVTGASNKNSGETETDPIMELNQIVPVKIRIMMSFSNECTADTGGEPA